MSEETFIPFELHKRNPEKYASCMGIKLMGAQREIQRLSGKLAILKSALTSAVEEIRKTSELRQTGWFVMLKKEGNGWLCVGCMNPDIHQDDESVDWDLIIPIPDPSTVPEFCGH